MPDTPHATVRPCPAQSTSRCSWCPTTVPTRWAHASPAWRGAPGTAVAIREHGTDPGARAHLDELVAAHPASSGSSTIRATPASPRVQRAGPLVVAGVLLFLNPDAEIVTWPWSSDIRHRGERRRAPDGRFRSPGSALRRALPCARRDRPELAAVAGAAADGAGFGAAPPCSSIATLRTARRIRRALLPLLRGHRPVPRANGGHRHPNRSAMVGASQRCPQHELGFGPIVWSYESAFASTAATEETSSATGST